MNEVYRYCGHVGVALYDHHGRWRLAIEPDETIAVRADWIDGGFVESLEPVTPASLDRITSLAELFASHNRVA